MSVRSDDRTEYARPVAGAGNQFQHAVAGLDAGEGHHRGNLAARIVLAVGRTRGIVDGGGEVGRRRGRSIRCGLLGRGHRNRCERDQCCKNLHTHGRLLETSLTGTTPSIVRPIGAHCSRDFCHAFAPHRKSSQSGTSRWLCPCNNEPSIFSAPGRIPPRCRATFPHCPATLWNPPSGPASITSWTCSWMQFAWWTPAAISFTRAPPANASSDTPRTK